MSRLYSRLGWDGLTLLACGIIAIVIGVLDFTPLLNISAENGLRLVIVAIGFVLGAIVALTNRFVTENDNLRRSLNGATVELFTSSNDLFAHACHNVLLDKTRHVWDTNLVPSRGKAENPLQGHNQLYKSIYQRIARNEISYSSVYIIYDKTELEFIVSRLIAFEGKRYSIRYYDAPPKAIPVLNILSVNDENFYLGGYSNSVQSGNSGLALIKGGDTSKLLMDYWSSLWENAKPLNEYGIDWEGLKAVAKRLSVGDEEFQSLVNTWKEKPKSN